MTYDGVGNVLTRMRVGGGTASVTYGYNRNSDQLSTATPSGSSALSYSYDADGNLLKRTLGKTTQLAIAYNADGRPMSAAGESFAYDGFGERVLIGITGGGTHDIFGLGGELLAENNSLGQPQRSYIYLNGVPLAVVDGFGNINYVLSGQLGQPQKMADGFGNLAWDMIADEFGQLVSQPVGQTSANALRFPGQVNDAATGLYYNHFRDYDPSLGRYVQTDPIGLQGGINPYTYADNNPTVLSDPTGQFLPLLVILPLAGGGIGGLADVLTAGPCDSKWGAFGRGFVAGAAGTFAGLVSGDNPWIAGAVGGGASQLVDQALSGDWSPGNLAIGTVTGGVASGAVSKLIPTVGRLPNLLIPRNMQNFGPNSARLLGREAANDIANGATQAGMSHGKDSNCSCQAK